MGMTAPKSGIAGCLLAGLACLAGSAGFAVEADVSAQTEWTHTEGAAGGGRYSPLAQIHPGNVDQLEQVWSYRHGDVQAPRLRPDRVNRSTSFEGTPLVFDGRLVVSTPFNRVIALDVATGRELWSFDPEIDRGRFFANMLINRGVALWRGGERASPCGHRILTATLDARLIALDAVTGRRCDGFGEAGEVDLLSALPGIADAHEYNVTSPPTVVGDVVVVGSSIADTVRRIQPPGDVQAFDVVTGEPVWTFHTIPHAGEAGHETWLEDSHGESGGANVWSTITADPERGWVFLPVSTASPDFYGGDRPGANLFSDSLVALDARNGERQWHFQTVHHDIWDYDLPAPPVLVEFDKDGVRVEAVVQVTKTGFAFVLDRETGRPVFPVEERPVPASDMPGERSWPTQPFPTAPPPLTSQHLREQDLWDEDPDHHEACRSWLGELRNEGMFTPPSLGGTIIHPSNGGGANWSGAAFDPVGRRLVVPVNRSANVVKLRPVWGAASNLANDEAQPMHGYLRAVWFLLSGRGTGLRYITHPLTGRVGFERDGKSCLAPPWGELVAVDLESETIAWRSPTGSGGPESGLFAYGPPLVTGGGLVFHAGTGVAEMRAHDLATGRVVATLPLPAGLHAGPISVLSEGRQLLIVAPGGHAGVRSPMGDWIQAYALPAAPSTRVIAPDRSLAR